MESVLAFDMGTRNLAFALVREPNVVQRVGMIDLQKHAARESSDALIQTLFGDNRWMLDARCSVVIELQPRSGVCKVLSHVLAAVFRTFDLAEFPDDPPRTIRFMHATKKFAADPDTYARLAPASYPERKEAAVIICRTILQNQPTDTCLAFFEGRNAKQKTDVADAVLQGCAFWAGKK